PCDSVAGLRQATERILEAVRLREHVLRRDAAIFEEELRSDRRAQRELAHVVGGGEARRAFLDDEAADRAFALRPDDRDIGDRSVRDPRLRAIEDPGIAVATRIGAHAAGVRAEVGLGEAEAADLLAGSELRNPVVALFLRAVRVDRIHDETRLHGGEGAETGIAALELLHDQAVRDVVRPGRSYSLIVAPKSPI